MIRLPPRSTRTDTLFPYTTLFRSHASGMPLVGRSDVDFPPGQPDRAKKCHRTAFANNFQIAAQGNSTLTSKFGMSSPNGRSEEHTSELQSLMRISYAVSCLKKQNNTNKQITHQATIN